MGDLEKAAGLVPPMKDVDAVKAGAEAIGVTAEEFADKFSSYANMFFERVTDGECYPIQDYDKVVLQLSTALKEQDIKRLSTKNAFLCGAALGWVFSGYLKTPFKQEQPKEG